MTLTIPFHERITCTVPDALQATGIGRTKLYDLIGKGLVETTKVGTRTLVVVASLKRLASPNAEHIAA